MSISILDYETQEDSHNGFDISKTSSTNSIESYQPYEESLMEEWGFSELL